jgi:hypothetical protein
VLALLAGCATPAETFWEGWPWRIQPLPEHELSMKPLPIETGPITPLGR